MPSSRNCNEKTSVHMFPVAATQQVSEQGMNTFAWKLSSLFQQYYLWPPFRLFVMQHGAKELCYPQADVTVPVTS